MRAIIDYTLEHELEKADIIPEILKIVSKTGFMPIFDQKDDVTIAATQNIFNEIEEIELPIVKLAYVATIFHEPSKSWGIITVGTEKAMTVRFKNSIEKKLKSACEDFIKAIHSQQDIAIMQFNPEEAIEVFEPGSVYPAYSGKILVGPALSISLREKAYEGYIALMSAILIVMLLYLTSPFSGNICERIKAEDIQLWLCGNIEKINSAIIVLFIISCMKILLHMFHIKRNAPILW